MAHIFLTREIPDAGLTLLRELHDVTIFEHDRQITKEELLEAVRDTDGLLCLLSDRVDADVIAAGDRLRCISNYAVGYNNIDVDAARERGIAVTNTPGVLTEATADIAFALMIACARRIVESDVFLRAGDFRGWEPKLFLGQDLVGRTLGIIGAGRIGRALAHRASRGFDMPVLYHNRKRDESFEREYGARLVDLDTLLRESDFISIHVPLTPETHHLIDARAIGLMKPSAVFVNTARGPVVDERALIDALRERRIFAAGFDVYENEPAVPRELIDLPNTVLLPHIGSASIETRDRMAEIAARNLLAVLAGKEPEFRVA
ncbi:MAG: D-glycerate dehydrogenase [Bacteroidota bacterium]|jgi:glyoxylate reductase|nr:D-glycerate dehydrogenase [Bacteroidota bacterium]